MGDRTTKEELREWNEEQERQRRIPRSLSWFLGGEIRLHRDRLHLSQADLAEDMRRAGVDWFPETVAKIEAGKREVTLGEVVALGLMLEVGVEDLLNPSLLGRVRLGKSEDRWVPGRVVQAWADGYRYPMYGYAELFEKYRDEGLAPLSIEESHVQNSRILKGQTTEQRKVSAALHRWAADEADAGRDVDNLRWSGKEAQLWQAVKDGQL